MQNQVFTTFGGVFSFFCSVYVFFFSTVGAKQSFEHSQIGKNENMDHVQAQMTKWSKELDKIPLLQKAQEATGVEKLYLVGGGAATLLLLLLVGFGAGLICNLVGFIYPAYESFKAVETDCKKDDVQWLTYWVVYACFNVVEVFADFLLYWIPFYYAFKLGFLLWLFMPSTQGASFLYTHFLAPFLKSQESRIDRAMKEAVNSGSAVISDVSGLVKDVSKDVSKAVANRIVEGSISPPKSPQKL